MRFWGVSVGLFAYSSSGVFVRSGPDVEREDQAHSLCSGSSQMCPVKVFFHLNPNPNSATRLCAPRGKSALPLLSALFFHINFVLNILKLFFSTF